MCSWLSGFRFKDFDFPSVYRFLLLKCPFFFSVLSDLHGGFTVFRHFECAAFFHFLVIGPQGAPRPALREIRRNKHKYADIKTLRSSTASAYAYVTIVSSEDMLAYAGKHKRKTLIQSAST